MIGRRQDERGYVAILAALMFATFGFGCAALGVDVARMFVEVQRVQKAADAGALSGVTDLPDLVSARADAIATSNQNGYPNSGTSSVTAELGTQSSQLKVTVCSTIKNSFGAVIGVGTARICRSAVSDFTGPQPMGNPCNTLGNEPLGTANTKTGPQASQLKKPDSDAVCSSKPQFWMNAAGPEVYKTQGDQYGVRYCYGNVSGNGNDPESNCSGSSSTSNDDYDPDGYFMLVRIDKNAVNKPYRVQLYDPAYVATSSSCTSAPTGTFPTSTNSTTFPNVYNWNDYTTTDANERYRRTATNKNGSLAENPSDFCSGDNSSDNLRHNDGSGDIGVITSYGLRAPTATRNPLDATPVAGCTKQYPGYTTVTVNNLTRGASGYKDDLALVFHQWTDLCTFTPTVPGDYYLQVRTNVPMQSSTLNDNGGYKPSSAASSPLYTQDGDNAAVLGNGINRYAVRVFATTNPVAGDVSVSAYGRMPIFANATDATPTFNLIRVLPAAAGKTLIFKFFDVGDAANSPGATMTVLPPTDATGTNISGTGTAKKITGCTATGYKTLTATGMPNCSISGIYGPDGWDGKLETIAVPIPSNYTCTNSTTTVNGGGCWFRVQMNFSGTTVTDATTWTASISGAPVRLIE